MDLVEVNHVGLQAFQTAFTRTDDVVRAEVGTAAPNPGHIARGAGYFGGNDQFLPCARRPGQPIPQDFFSGVVRFGPGGARRTSQPCQ